MNIGEPLRELGEIDHIPLRDRILSLDEVAWNQNLSRQEMFDVHKKTSSLVMIFCDGWPEINISKEQGWDHMADLAVPLMDEIIKKHYEPGGTIIRAMAAKLFAGERITPHVDKHPSFHIAPVSYTHLTLPTNREV